MHKTKNEEKLNWALLA